MGGRFLYYGCAAGFDFERAAFWELAGMGWRGGRDDDCTLLFISTYSTTAMATMTRM